MLNKKLSENFSFNELVNTSHTNLKEDNIYYGGHPAIVRNLTYLSQEILQPIRDHFGKPMVITSGFRSSDLNTKVGGSLSSRHLSGEAADFYIPGIDNMDIFDWVKHKSDFVYGQCILEPSWIHISYPEVYEESKQNLVAIKTGSITIYQKA